MTGYSVDPSSPVSGGPLEEGVEVSASVGVLPVSVVLVPEEPLVGRLFISSSSWLAPFCSLDFSEESIMHTSTPTDNFN